jgi:hypothetical protein
MSRHADFPEYDSEVVDEEDVGAIDEEGEGEGTATDTRVGDQT